jgi:hypothetical protein
VSPSLGSPPEASVIAYNALNVGGFHIIVMEFEVNQILITPLGGDLDKPLYMYQAHLYVCTDILF